MPGTITRKSKSKVDTTQPLKSVVVETPAPLKKYVCVKSEFSTKSAIVSASKVKKILDTNNTEVMEVITHIKKAIDENKEVKKGLSDKQLDIVGKYINKHKHKLEGKAEPPSTNEISLRAFLDQKFKFKKDLTMYLAVVCDLMLEEIMQTSMEYVLSIDKKRINSSHILDSKLSDKLLYPLYCKLPSYLEQTAKNASPVLPTSTEESEDVPVVSTTDVSVESPSKLSKSFLGNIKSIFNVIKGENENRLIIQKKYQEFLSNLLVEFLERVSKLLLITLKNTSTSKFIVKNTGITVIESIMQDYDFETSRYSELFELVNDRE